jgi:DNA-binding NarL/FixJ family response regulator
MIEVFITEDHAVVTEGIRSLLQHEKDIVVVGHASSAAACFDYFARRSADVLLLDIGLPDMNGVDLCGQLKSKYPHLMILALSTYNQGTYVRQMMESGGSGYLLKNVEAQELATAIRTVARGKLYLSTEAGKVYKAAVEKKNSQPLLTRREQEVLRLIAEGFTNGEIGQRLFISVDTVDSHRKNLYTKLGVNNTAKLVRLAMEQEIL